jgi:hypothetical protein
MKMVCTIALLVAFATSRPAVAAPLTPQQMNFGILHNSVGMTVSMIQQTLGVDSATLNFSGTFDDTSWTTSLTGQYAGRDINLLLTAAFDTGSLQGTYLSSGAAGGANWQGTGAWSFGSAVGPSINLNWSAEATIQGDGFGPFVPDRVGDGGWLPSELNGTTHIIDFGLYRLSLFGRPLPFPSVKVMDSDKIVPNNPGSAFASVRLRSEAIEVTGTGHFAETAGAVAGTVSVPEPSTALLCVIGLLALAVPKRVAGHVA